MFSLEHLLALLFFIFLGVFLILWAKKQPSDTQNKVGVFMADFIAFWVILWSVIKLWLGKFTLQEDLPFHLCNFIGLAVLFISRKKSYLAFEILFFWIIAGTLQGLITPVLYNSFPNYNFIKFWIVHAGLVVYILYVVFVQKMYPTFKSIFKSVAALSIYAGIVYIINDILNANYLFLQHKPEGGSLLDAFGEWPQYIFVTLLIIIPFFGLIYLPFYISDKLSNKNKNASIFN